jgi:hypothetical protein
MINDLDPGPASEAEAAIRQSGRAAATVDTEEQNPSI